MGSLWYSRPSQSLGRHPPRDGAAHRHRHGRRQGVPRHARGFAEFETNLRKERQLEGIAKAKAAGVYKGRKPTIDPKKVRDMKAAGIRPRAIAKQLGIGRASVYKVLGQA